ncbi:MAG TPA: efflux RND transporter periplasmic adaptor subunit, partial [Terriglobia bacterium]|nr:efflux RND transporter periplasmic adaptor subunit [Terriglobia bacterium]
MATDLHDLKIDRGAKKPPGPSKWATRWIIGGVGLLVLLGVVRVVYRTFASTPQVETVRVASASAAGDPGVSLNATGYIVAHHEIEVASKVVGKVEWIGVEKGDAVKKGQELVRLEDTEYQAQLQQARGNLMNLQARLAELEHGSRPQEIDQAHANLLQAQADLANAKLVYERNQALVADGVVSKQEFDTAQFNYKNLQARVNSLQQAYDLVKIGPRREDIDAMKGQVEQAKGVVDFSQDQLDNTIIRAPIDGTILERAVEKGEFVTNGFVGDKGAKGYVVTLADLNDLQVELDIAQNDFAKLHMGDRGTVTTDAYPDRKYEGKLVEISPKADRQKATVQVKVQILHPDSYLRPEMNASVSFLADEKPGSAEVARPAITVPASAVQNGAVFVVLGGRAVRRTVKAGAPGSQGVRIEQGLIGGEDVIVN